MAEPFTRWEQYGAMLAAAAFPFWFIHVPGINIVLGDVLAICVAASYTIRTGQWNFSPSRVTGISVAAFLLIGGLSVLWSPDTNEALRKFLQYGLVFTVVIPVIVIGFSDYRRRWHLYSVLTALLSGVIISGSIVAILTRPDMQYFSFVYGNQNTFYWVVATGIILLVGFAAQGSKRLSRRIAAVSIAALGGMLILSGNSMTAILATGVGIWIITFWLLRQAGNTYGQVALIGISTLCLIVGGVLIGTNWETFYREAVLQQRIPMYQQAWASGLNHFPWGIGLGGSAAVLSDLPGRTPPITHNFVLHYWLTVGVVGLASFLTILWAWGRNVPLRMIRRPGEFRVFEVAFVAVFLGYLVIALFQPPPVRRFWWMFYAVGWATVIK